MAKDITVCEFTKTLVEHAKSVGEDVDEVRIYPDASFEVHGAGNQPKGKKQKTGTQDDEATSAAVEEVLILSSDEEDDGDICSGGAGKNLNLDPPPLPMQGPQADLAAPKSGEKASPTSAAGTSWDPIVL